MVKKDLRNLLKSKGYSNRKSKNIKKQKNKFSNCNKEEFKR